MTQHVDTKPEALDEWSLVSSATTTEKQLAAFKSENERLKKNLFEVLLQKEGVERENNMLPAQLGEASRKEIPIPRLEPTIVGRGQPKNVKVHSRQRDMRMDEDLQAEKAYALAHPEEDFARESEARRRMD